MRSSKSYFQRHWQRIQSLVHPGDQERRLSRWITESTRLGGMPFSFINHEYQEFILNLNAIHYAIKKPSQIGISELNVRRALGICCLNANVSLAYILPTMAFSQKFAKSRVDPVVAGSPDVLAQMSPGNDSSVMKQFRNDSFLYFMGASRSNQAISTPLDAMIEDELDFFEDLTVLTQFTSRLKHSKLDKNKFMLSTPTVGGYGISALYDNSKQYIELQKCNHCGHWFHADYFNDVVLPGFEKSLHAVSYTTKSLIADFDLSTAYLSCPKCKKRVDQSLKYRNWVCVNPDSHSDTAGVHITPFTAPGIITPGQLIHNSTEYSRISDFYNFELGLEHSDTDSEVTREELMQAVLPPEDAFYSYTNPPPYAVMGIDVGGLCAVTIGYPSPQGPLIVVHAELVPVRKFAVRYAELCSKFRVISVVIDSLPYTDLVLQLQARDPNLWASLFSSSKAISLYSIREKTEDDNAAFSGVRALLVARDRGLDQTVAMIRGKNIMFEPAEWNETVFKHIMDLKRIKLKDSEGEDVFRWRKSAGGQDHAFFSLLYMFIAFCVKGLSGPVAMPLPLLQKIRTKGRV